jgi:hypothetical protein
MPRDEHLDFYRRRLAEESEAEAAETRPALIAAHRLLREIYSEQVEENPPRPATA